MKYLKKLVMLILLLLVILFMAGMGIMSSLNLDYSQRAMSELRLKQIEESFYANIDRIDTHHRLIEKNTAELARLGELFYALKQHSGKGRSASDHTHELGAALQNRISEFHEAVGGGIWFDPGVYDTKADRFGAYSYWKNDRTRLNWADTGELKDYLDSEWYRRALPPEWDRNKARPDSFYWTPAYYNPLLKAAVITLSTFMKDENGRILGLATTDWRADEIIELVSEVDITPSSFSFLIDEKNRKLSGLSEQDTLASRSLLEQISEQTFTNYAWPAARLMGNRYRIPMQTMTLQVDGNEYVLFFSRTVAGMTFGISVPHDEIDSVLEPMRESNYRIAIMIGVILLLLSALILYIVAGIMRLLETLYTDGLTGLPNRVRLLQELKKTRQKTLILMNIDSFREINDFYGHQCGDSVLRDFADSLHAFLKGMPEFGKAKLYRMPADEFVITLQNVLGQAELENCLNALSAFAGARVFKWDDQDIELGVTMGAADIATTSGDKAPAEKSPLPLLPFANMALKAARRTGRHYLIYEPGLRIREEYEHNLLLARGLKAALQERRIYPYFQPIYNNRTGEVEKYESLARMLDEKGQTVPPGEFLHIGKKLRLHRYITLMMVEQVIDMFRDRPGEFSINLAYEDIVDPDTTGFIKDRLVEYGLARRAVFEILESEIIRNYERADAFVREFQNLGCKIAIDDFGSGYSNFENLLRLKVDIIKIDGCLIRNIDTDHSAAILIEGIVNFARKLKIQTVAEFVHSAAVQQKVEELGINYSQGYFIGKPEPDLPEVTGTVTGLAANSK